jgi:hypothetical protein
MTYTTHDNYEKYLQERCGLYNKEDGNEINFLIWKELQKAYITYREFKNGPYRLTSRSKK